MWPASEECYFLITWGNAKGNEIAAILLKSWEKEML
jgi:hypothetical protein